MEPGGHADKGGGTYEDRWAVRQLLRIVAGEIRSVERERAGPEGAGVDLWLELPSGVREAHQCKAGKAFRSQWSIADLAREGVLEHLREHAASPQNRFCFVSGLPAPQLKALARSAVDSRDPQSFWEHQVKPSKKRKQAFDELCTALSIAPENPSELTLAHDLLRRTQVHLFQDTEEELRQLRTEARRWVCGDPDRVLDALERWSRDQLRRVLHFDEVTNYLRSCGLALRSLAQDPQLMPKIELLQERFRRSFRNLLVGGELLPRPETDDVLQALKQNRLILVHGVAGSGKSGVLYEVAQRLAQAGTPYLPLRLDRQTPRASAQRFGDELGLPESPAFCLREMAGEREAVLLLDQMDALRWTSAHSGEAWEICQEVMREALGFSGVRIVVCCRTFDLEHDPQIRAWASAAEGARRIAVGDLPPNQVAQMVGRLGGAYDDLSPTERSLLANFSHLSLWSAIIAKTGLAPRFSSARELLRAFWNSRYDALAVDGVTHVRAKEILDRLVDFMERNVVLAAPLRVLAASEQEEAALRSNNILQVDVGQVSFAHQSYLDYLAAQRVMTEIERGAATVRAWLGSRARQTLFLRERLRLVLGYLRDERPEDYLSTVRDLLGNAEVRFQMKQLTLEALGQVTDPRSAEVDLVLELLNDESWRPHALADIVGGSVPWFEALDDRGLAAEWLGGEDRERRQAMIGLMRRVAAQCGERVARLVAPYELDDSPREQHYTAEILPTSAASDSEAMFALRLRLARSGLPTRGIVDWSGLAKRSFTGFVQLIEAMLSAQHQKAVAGDPGRHLYFLGDAHWPSFEAIELGGVADDLLCKALRSLGQALDQLRVATADSFDPANTLETSRLHADSLGKLANLLKIFAAKLVRGSLPTLAGLLEGQEALAMPAQLAILDALGSGPLFPEVADLGLAWLIAEPSRLRLRYTHYANPWELSGRLIALSSPCCSASCFERLERFLLDFKEPDFLDRYRARHRFLFWRYRDPAHDTGFHRDLGSLNRPSFAGATPHHLLRHLAADRRLARTKRVMQELERKFSKASPAFFAGSEQPGGGAVRSPISQLEILERLSDRSWLRLMTSETVRNPRHPFRRIGKGIFEESSVASFSSDVRAITERHPERFARLALRLSAGTDPRFLGAILSGLASGKVRAGSHLEEDHEWQPASQETLEAVLSLPAVNVDDFGMDVCRLIERYPDYLWSDAVLLRVVEIARHHPDPQPGQSGVIVERSEDDENDHLSINALNCTRGAAGYAIQKLLFERVERLPVLRPALESLVIDSHLAVRVAAVAASLPVLNIDRRQAMEWFLAACEADEPILATHEVSDFLRYTLSQDLGRLRPLIERMIESRLVTVARAGARWVCAAFLQGGDLAELFARCLAGTSAHRQGVAEMAAALLGSREHHAAAKPILQQLADDPEHTVQQKVLEGISRIELDIFPAGDPFLVAFAASRAFKFDPSPLLFKLERHVGSLLDFAPCLLQVGRTFAEDLAPAVRDPRRGLALDVHVLVPLLLRLYDDSSHTPDNKDIHQACLDLWDALLEGQVMSAAELTHELGRL